MAGSTIISKMASCQYPFAQGKICSWADYEMQVKEGIINDMDEPLTLRDASSPEPESGEELSRSSSICTSIAPANPDVEKLMAMLQASVLANQTAQCGQNPVPPSSAMAVAPANPHVQALSKEMDNKYAEHKRRLAECQEKGDIQGYLDLTVAGPAPRDEQEDWVQKGIDKIEAAAKEKKEKEQAGLNMLLQGLNASSRVTKRVTETNPAIILGDPAIIFTSVSY